MATLAELRDLLTALGISTSTGSLRGEERRVVLQQRLLDAQQQLTPIRRSGNGNGQGKKQSQTSIVFTPATEVSLSDQLEQFQHMPLVQLRKELEDRALTTQTPGLKGEARRHALIQRLINTTLQGINPSQLQHNTFSSTSAASVSTSRSIVEDDVDGCDMRSMSSSSSYSEAGEFLFFDLPSSRQPRQENQEHQAKAVPDLRLHKNAPLSQQTSAWGLPEISLDSEAPQDRTTIKTAQEKSFYYPQLVSLPVSDLENELFELRKRLHAMRKLRHQDVEQRLQQAGFSSTLEELSRKIEHLEKERQRLVQNFFAHELVKVPRAVLILGSFTPRTEDPCVAQTTMELVQEDAVQLLAMYQSELKKQVQQTQQALAIIKNSEIIENQSVANPTLVEQEKLLIETIHRLEAQLKTQSASAISERQPEMATWRSTSSTSSFSSALSASHDFPVLTRCRSASNSMFIDTWKALDVDQRQQLCHELRASASFRIQRDRISIGQPLTGRREQLPIDNRNNIQVPSLPTRADTLGIKAQFLEHGNHPNSNLVEISRTYQQALQADPMHARNLGNYALFLYRRCSHMDQAERYFQLGLKADPSDPTNLSHYASFLVRVRHDVNKAELLYQKAIQIAPMDVNMRGNYANLLRKKGTRAYLLQAKCELEKAIELVPGHIRNFLLFASVLSELDEVQAAQRCYEQLLALLPATTKQKNNDMATTMKRNGANTASACKEYAHVYGNYANFLRKQGQWQDAKRMYINAMALNPQHPLLLRNFSLFLRESRLLLSPR